MLLSKNGHPSGVVNYSINDVLSRQQNKPRNPTAMVPQKRYPFCTKLFRVAKQNYYQTTQGLYKFYGCIDLRVIFHNTYRIKSLKRPKLYKANCWDCQDFYIGKTKRGLHDRKSKHFKAIISASSIHISTLLKVRNEKYSILVTDIIVLSCQCIHLPL